jgi:small neutral amino acid transporter SnatA (MarC family)
MKKVVGYILCILGLIILTISAGIIKINLAFLNSTNPYYIMGTGIGLVIVGTILVMLKQDKKKSKEKQSEEEVPIYEGTGKKRKIVGYRRS